MRMSLIRWGGCRKDERCCKSSKCDSNRRTRGLMMRLRDNKTWQLVRLLYIYQRTDVSSAHSQHQALHSLHYSILYSLQASRVQWSDERGGGVTWRTAWSEHIIISNDRKHQTPFSVSKDPDMASINALFILRLLLISRLRPFPTVVE